MVDSPENLTMIEHNESLAGQSDVSLNLNLPVSSYTVVRLEFFEISGSF